MVRQSFHLKCDFFTSNRHLSAATASLPPASLMAAEYVPATNPLKVPVGQVESDIDKRGELAPFVHIASMAHAHM